MYELIRDSIWYALVVSCLAYAFSGCAHAGDFTVAYNVQVFAEDGTNPQPEHMDYVIKNTAALVHNLDSEFFDAEKTYKFLMSGAIYIYVHADKLKCKSNPDKKCMGYMERVPAGIDIHYWENDECIGRTALAHEVLHTLLWLHAMQTDVNHESRPIWAERTGLASIEYKSNEVARARWCK